MADFSDRKGPLSVEDEHLALYLKEISNIPLLTAEQEVQLAKKIKRSNQDALDTLVKSNLRFVVSVAVEYKGQGLPLLDLINEGNLGLIKAAKKFDETKGFKFISYAVWWIRQAITQALADQTRVVRLPINRINALHKIGKISGALEQELERPPTAGEIAEHLEMGDGEVLETLSLSSKHASMDAPFPSDGDRDLHEILEDEGQLAPDTDLLSESRLKAINEALKTLTPREAETLRLYFGIGTNKTYTLKEIGDKYGVSRERARQIKVRAIRRLRHASRSRRLKSHLT